MTKLWDAVTAALEDRDQGTALDDAVRDHWPQGREWKYLCNACGDTGLIIEQRPARIYGGKLVDVGVPCHCRLGARFRPRPVAAPANDDAAAGKKSPTKPTRLWGHR